VTDEGGYGRFGALSRVELERFFYLDDEDRKLIAGRRRDYNRLGFVIFGGIGTVYDVADVRCKSPGSRGGRDYLSLSITEREVGTRVKRVLMPGTGFESWTLLGDDHMPVKPVERFLSYLASIEKSPNTIKAYAHDLKYLNRHSVDWRTARLEDVAGFVAWLRLPPQARDGRVAVLPTVTPHCSENSVNRKLSAVTSF
jgi:hypothetical protein